MIVKIKHRANELFVRTFTLLAKEEMVETVVLVVGFCSGSCSSNNGYVGSDC